MSQSMAATPSLSPLFVVLLKFRVGDLWSLQVYSLAVTQLMLLSHQFPVAVTSVGTLSLPKVGQ